MDVRKFYPSVDKGVLMTLVARKIKDKRVLKLIETILIGCEGLAIGNYISQPLGNLYLSGLDHYLKQNLKCRAMVRYCDDITVFSNSKEELHLVRVAVQKYLSTNLNLQLKNNYRVFPVSIGVDFLGYVSYPEYTRIRKSIKKRYAKMLKYRPNKASIASYNGWLTHADCINLKNILENSCIFE